MKGQHTISNRSKAGRYRMLSIGLTGLAMVLLPGLVLAFDDHGSIRDTAIRHSVPSQILTVADSSKKSEESPSVDASYNPSATYPGIYKSDQLYRRNPDSGGWAGSARPSHLKQVGCPKAKESLTETGSWKGQLNKNGSCGTTAEPAEWAVGNLLNYENSLNETMEETE
ncbi:MAG: hypothetical protein L0Y56_13825 [Nitrospira sp.]|nr:hypothetical protein [Nitrospira sp.]